MENVFQLAVNGQSVVQADFNTLGSYGLIDDRVLAELLRLTPYNGSTVVKAVLPYGATGTTGQTVGVNGASGSVLLRPFRAIIGSRTAMGTSALDNWRDIRSAIYVGGATSLSASVVLGVNSSGNPRWDLVYASVSVDQNSTPVARKVKDPASHAIAPQNVSLYKLNLISVQVAAGTPGATPAFPSTPADGGGSYIVPLAYVRVPNGFNGTSTVLSKDIVSALTMAQNKDHGTGPANAMYAAPDALGGLTTTVQGVWGSTATRPAFFMPPEFGVGPSRLIALDMKAGSSASWSHQSGAILDGTIDWRKRYFKWHLAIGTNGGSYKFPHSANTAGGNMVPGVLSSDVSAGGFFATGMGQSFNLSAFETGASIAGPMALYVDQTQCAAMASGSWVALYVDPSTAGSLMLQTSVTSPLVDMFIWLEATTQFPNY
jgi:hypothetical protein